MNPEEALIYLSACAVNRRSPDSSLISDLNLDSLYRIAYDHQLTALTAFALESCGIRNHRFSQEIAVSIRRILIFDQERDKILKELEDAGIWYMPLKGAILKDYYPHIGSRQMSDNDILVDASRADDVHEIMTKLGYQTAKYEVGHRDDYQKPPSSHFEMHRVLFTKNNGEEFYNYYLNVKDRLVKDEGNRFGYHFTDEDFYLYMIAHEFKHYDVGGTGIRSLLDTYVFLRHFEGSLDWSYIKAECRKLGITDFEEKNRSLALALFTEGSTEKLTAEQRELFSYFVGSGTYGTKTNAIQNVVKKQGKWKYVLNRVFLPMDAVKEHYPVFYRHKILLPVLPLYRLIREWSRAKAEVKIMKRTK